MMLRILAAVALGLCISAKLAASDELAPPVRLEANGKAIDTEIGHAAPFVTDFDGDGVQDLLVGQFGGGQLWIYRNEGTNAEPKLAAGLKFKQGKDDGRVPTG
ncbi:MAG: VCBS repeat-containing protein [Planctomycetes bacterium]|nr:VCBS repeat-containing protein [Planctomycetota bacterium]MBL7040516.1 VCBS repeat-containing protein [Pirellulaceae bacterium]